MKILYRTSLSNTQRRHKLRGTRKSSWTEKRKLQAWFDMKLPFAEKLFMSFGELFTPLSARLRFARFFFVSNNGSPRYCSRLRDALHTTSHDIRMKSYELTIRTIFPANLAHTNSYTITPATSQWERRRSRKKTFRHLSKRKKIWARAEGEWWRWQTWKSFLQKAILLFSPSPLFSDKIFSLRTGKRIMFCWLWKHNNVSPFSFLSFFFVAAATSSLDPLNLIILREESVWLLYPS